VNVREKYETEAVSYIAESRSRYKNPEKIKKIKPPNPDWV